MALCDNAAQQTLPKFVSMSIIHKNLEQLDSEVAHHIQKW
jgi:hypothetical protein